MEFIFFYSISKETIINIDNFFGKDDLIIKITRSFFNDLCKDLYNRIEVLIYDILKETEKVPNDIDVIILSGGATRMPRIKELLRRIFGDGKIRDNLNPDESVAFGATLEAAKMQGKNKNNFNLKDINAYALGIAVNNTNYNDFQKNGLLMHTIIKKYSEIPASSEQIFKAQLSKNCQNINISIFEGNDKYTKKNAHLGEMFIKDINKIGIVEFKVKFSIEANSELKVALSIDSLGKKEIGIIKYITNGFYDKENRKAKICKTKKLKPTS